MSVESGGSEVRDSANYGAMERAFEKIYAATPMQIKQKEKNEKAKSQKN